jgi:hypothetical protein
MADEPTSTVVEDVVPVAESAPVIDPYADLKASFQAQTDAMLTKIGQLESRLSTGPMVPERSSTGDMFPVGHPLHGCRTDEEVKAKINELHFSDPTAASELLWSIKAGPIIQELRSANAVQAKKAALEHPVYGPLLKDPTILKTFEEGWARLPDGQRVHENAAIETASWAAGRHMDIATKRAADDAVAEAIKRAPTGHSHGPSPAAAAPKAAPVELSQEERDIARKLGVAEKDYAHYKAE